MGSAVFALIFLSSGYLFLRRWRITRPHAFRWDGHALYFSVVIASLVLVMEADLLRAQVEAGGTAGIYITDKLSNLLTSFATDQKLRVLGLTALWSVPIAIVGVAAFNTPKALLALKDPALFADELFERARGVSLGNQYSQHACNGYPHI